MSERAETPGAAFWGDVGETEALQRYRTLVNAIDDGIYQLDADGHFVAVNDVILETTGYAREELVGEHVSALLDDEDVSTVENGIERRLTGHADRTETFEFTVRTADDERVPCELRLNLLVEDGAFRGTVGTVREITDRKRTERVLDEREQQLNRERDLTDRVLETSPVAVTVLDSDGEVARMNERAGDTLGVSERERETYSPADRATYDEQGRPVPVDEHPFARTLETGEPVYDRVLRVERPDGDSRWLSVNAAPILTGDGEVDRVVTTAEDITGIKERERKLESELDEVFERVTDAFYALDDQWRFTHVNDRAEELIDYRGEGLVGKNIWEVFEWGADSKLGEEYRAAMESQEPTSFELYYPDPLESWYELHAYPSETGLSVYFRDVTERKERERELERSERRYRTLVEHFPNGAVALVDRNLRYRTIGGTPPEEADATIDELRGRPVREILSPELADVLVPRYVAALDGESSSFEGEFDDHVYQFHVVPVRDDDGNVFAALGMSQDITEQKERERYLREAKSQLEAATEAGAVGTWEWQIPDDQFVADASFAGKFGVDPDDAREGVSLERFVSSIHEADRDRVEAKIEETVEVCGEYEAEYRVRDADGELRWVVARGHVECDEDGNPVTFPGALTDITERKRAEEALEEHRKQLETLFRALPVGVVVADASGRLVEANETAREIWGGDIFDANSVDEYDRYTARWADTDEPVDPEGWTMSRVLRGEEVTDPDVYEIEAADGTQRIVMCHGMPVRDASGDVSRGVVTQTDITGRKKRERQLQRQNDRLESFASMLAHELRNPVSIGQIYLPQAVDGDESAAEEVATALDRVEATIDTLLVLARGSDVDIDPEPVTLRDAAADVWSNLDARGDHLQIETDLVLDVDPLHLRHLLENLLRNAVEHGSTSPSSQAQKDAVEHGSTSGQSKADDAVERGGGGVRVRIGPLDDGFYVEDDGPGIPEAERERVFEAGYTTDADGIGLGLTFIAQLADAYGWECTITESAGGGARFEFRGVDIVSRG